MARPDAAAMRATATWVRQSLTLSLPNEITREYLPLVEAVRRMLKTYPASDQTIARRELRKALRDCVGPKEQGAV